MTGISPISWQQEHRLYHLRNDAEELARLVKAHGLLDQEWLEHIKVTTAYLQGIIDAHVLQPVSAHVQADERSAPVAVAVHEEQAP